MRVGCMFIIFVVNNLFETGFELNMREEEDASAFCSLPALHRCPDKQALYGLFCPVNILLSSVPVDQHLRLLTP